ncbi:MAG: hypothetical protein IKS51_09120 [Erysipelotrichaceae bacterium]|nr:hypothetical protein [Erysipelotrichaceae bacterium]
MDKKTMLIICLAILILSEVSRRAFKNAVSNKLTRLLLNGEYEAFDKLADRFYTKYLVAPFNLDYIKMNSYLSRGDDRKVKEIFDHFENCRLNKAQRFAVYSNAFYYYLTLEDTQKCKKYYKLLKENADASQDTTMIDWLNDAYVENGTKYLDEILSRYENARDSVKPQLDALLARNYENKGDKKNANIYNKKLNEYAKELDQKLNEQQEGKKDVE